MKHLKLFLTLSIISLLAMWSFATIEIQTTTPRVNPDGNSELVGTFRMIFSAPEFTGMTSTGYYVLVRVQMSQGVQLKKIGNNLPSDVSVSSPIVLAVEQDAGAVTWANIATGAVQIIGFGADHIDILFTDDMSDWGLDAADRVRVTIGTGPNATPTDTANMGAGLQDDTRLCCDFAVTNQDFVYDDFWKVGMTTWKYDATSNVLLDAYNVNYQPADPALAQKGGPQDVCQIQSHWPSKGDPCNIESGDEGPSIGETCPQGEPGQNGTTDPCDTGSYTGTILFGSGHEFVITESCPSSVGGWVFEPGATIEISISSSTDTNLGATLNGCATAWLYDGTSQVAVPVSIAGNVLTLTLPNDPIIDPNRTEGLCLGVDLCKIDYDACAVENMPENQSEPINIDIEYFPPNFVCGVKPLPIQDFKVADVYGCVPVAQQVALGLYFPFFAPINNTDVTWWCGFALTNYADQATDGGVFYFWEDDGDAFTVDIPALGPHEQYIRNLSDLTFVPQGADTVAGDEGGMSGILIMLVTEPGYDYLNGIDAFVLMGDNTQAYGYVARHLDSDMAYYSPLWTKSHQHK